ncbi:MAG: metallophosphoesterase [Candidatus Bathyarchaeota archaeon]|nr:metallophosphoesterase [Candidatus Bathyarchaeota archaeon]
MLFSIVTADSSALNDEFSIIQISDTQHLSSMHPAVWPQLTNWLMANNACYNIRMVVHTGDIVDSGENLPEWENANSSMSQLLQAGIPYVWDAGNHDQNKTDRFYSGNPNGGWLGSNFLAFNATYLHSKPYWVSDVNDGKNTAAQFTYRNYSVLVINLEFHANQTALDWMINLIETHPNYHVIVATHSYLNGLQGYGYPYSPDSPDWENNLRTILDKYPNVFLTLGGHYIHTIYPAGEEETSNYTRINTRQETFFNRQMALGDGGCGAAAVRIFTFNVANPNDTIIQARTYDIYSNIWRNDEWNQFSFHENTKATAAAAAIQPLQTPANGGIDKSQFPCTNTRRPLPLTTPTQLPPSPLPTPLNTPTSIIQPTITPTMNNQVDGTQSLSTVSITIIAIAILVPSIALAKATRKPRDSSAQKE